jgi:hypothetical protein
MIELSQPAQCLFCPQRRKIALLLKLVMAGSAAIITAIILFYPGNKQVATRRGTSSFQGSTTASNAVAQVFSEGRPVERSGASPLSKRSTEILTQAQERFQEIQAQLRPLLSEEMLLSAKAQRLLDARRREIVKTKVIILGEALFSDSVAAEAEKKRVLEQLDKELNVLAEQKKLLAELKEAN